MIEVFTTGGIILDNVVAADGTVHLETMGGNAVYSAAGARLWLQEVGCVGIVPHNYPTRWLDTLMQAGVDLTGVRHEVKDVDCPEWFFHREDGSRVDHLHAETAALAAFGLDTDRIAPVDVRRFEAHLRARSDRTRGFGAFREAHPVEPDHVPASFWRDARAVHLAPNRLDAQCRLAERARTAGLVVSLDPGRQADAMGAADLDALLSLCDVVLPSEKELRVLTPGDEPGEAVRRLSTRGRAVVLVKLGSAGSIVFDRRAGVAVHIAALAVDAPDPTGAGDAYCGGYLAGLIRTADPVLAACCGTVSASFAVEAFGPMRLLDASPPQARERLRHVLARVPETAGAAGLDALFQGS